MLGITQFEHFSDPGAQLIGEARKVLDNNLDKWDFEDLTNPNFEEAAKQESTRNMWRIWYDKIFTWTLKMINTSTASTSRSERTEEMFRASTSE